MLNRKPILLAAGTNSAASWSCLPGKPSRLTSMPVTFPPGRASLAIKPKSNGVRHRTDHDRHRCCGPLQNESRRRDLSHNDVWLQTNQLFCECGQSFQKSVGVSLHKIDVPIFQIARFMQPLEETVSISREA